ncbi:hypothetical protein FG379_000853 [Cryptosporidium bovis]|uniref:uncharacterized protein n=1 Tax=Cryptosporidium bovis TaxID=310047 RepID=UPI003519E6C0|nr:hypothetical protein FG379_000853 [Cryptosporidium bovis]
MSETASKNNHISDEIICLGKGVYRISEMTKTNNTDGAESPIEIDNSELSPFLEGVEIYAQEPQGKGYSYVPNDSKCSVIIVIKANESEFKEIRVDTNFQVKRLQYSPLGSYLLVLTAYDQLNNENNLNVYKFRNSSFDLLFSFPFRTNSAKVLSTWPPYRWSNNELFVFKVQETSVSIYKGDVDNLNNPICSLNYSKSIELSISNEIRDNDNISVNFSVVCQNSSQNIYLYVYNLEMLNNNINISCIGNLEIKQAQTTQVLWNYKGNGILVFTQIEGETLGKSYFGSSSLHLLRIQNAKTVVASTTFASKSLKNNDNVPGMDAVVNNNINEKLNSTDANISRDNSVKNSDKYSLRHIIVVPPEEGPVNDVAWSPISNDFLLCKGTIPPELTLNNGYDGTPKVSFGKSRRNTIRWNPSGKWFAYGGFGNLAGDLDIWDLEEQKLIGQTNASCCITLEWSIDGRYLLASTTSPRLRVDNAIRIFRYNGDLLKRVNFDTLYSAYWAPCTPKMKESVVFRSVSPGREFSVKPLSEKQQVYRPKWASSDFAEKMRAARDTNTYNTPRTLSQNKTPTKSDFIIPGLPTLEASSAAANINPNMYNNNRNYSQNNKSKFKPKRRE